VTKPFGGFQLDDDDPVRIPGAFFHDVLPQLTDVAEIQVTLCVLRLVDRLGGLDRAVQEAAIRRDRDLRSALRVEGTPNEPDRRISAGLDLATGRGTLLKVVADHRGEQSFWYYVNTLANQAQVAAMSRGSTSPPPDLWRDGEAPAVQAERPTIFRLYEQNIGMLTPLIAERLVDALETYPATWIEEAIGEAVNYNRRNWRYVSRILENWAVAGRGDRGPEGGRNETHRRGDPGHIDPDQYKQGRHLDRTGRG
jgi:DnaD/phage-associated family protein